MNQKVIFEGIILGLTLSIMLGPAFFAHLQASIYKGFWASTFLFIGIGLSDSTLIFLNLIGTAKLLENHNNKLILGFVGGIVLVVFGIASYLKKVKFKDMRLREETLNTSSVIKYITKGFLLNIANPFVWIFWIGVVTLVSANYVDHANYYSNVISFFSIVIGMYTVLSLLKGALAFKIKRLIKTRTIIFMNKVVGVILVFFGLILIIQVVVEYV